jgi:hypothetical protein
MIAIDGSCHCGRIRYEAEVDPEHVTICHCTDCQALTGAAFRVSVSTERSRLRITGEPRVYVKFGDSGRKRFQYFCPECGSPLFTNGEGEDADIWGIRWGGVRQRERLKPTKQIWRRSAPDWVCAFEDAPARMTE